MIFYIQQDSSKYIEVKDYQQLKLLLEQAHKTTGYSYEVKLNSDIKTPFIGGVIKAIKK